MNPASDEMLNLLRREQTLHEGSVAPLREAKQAYPDGFHLTVEPDSRMVWHPGRGVTLDHGPTTHPDTARLFLEGSMTAAIAAAIGFYTFHGSVVAWNGRAVILTGPSGAGKSTFAAALATRGHPLLSDDLTLLVETDGGPPLVIPWHKPLKLWADSLALTGLPAGERIAPDYAKFTVTVPREENPLPLGGVVMLVAGERDWRRLSAGDATRVWAQEHYCRSFLASARDWTLARQFADAAAMAAQVPVWQFAAPRGGGDAAAFALALDFIEASLDAALP